MFLPSLKTIYQKNEEIIQINKIIQRAGLSNPAFLLFYFFNLKNFYRYQYKKYFQNTEKWPYFTKFKGITAGINNVKNYKVKLLDEPAQ